MIQPVPIIEVLSRATQGATRPFLCRCEDGHLYWAKGAAAGTMALLTEWVVGRLGQHLGLPIPEMAILYVPPELIAESAFPGIEDLGTGNCFGSRHVEGAQEYDSTMIERTDQLLRWKILSFDYWVRNTDRTFSRPYGSSGNPNLLWCMGEGSLRVIDHNNALLPNDMLDIGNYRRHVFVGERGHLTTPFKLDMATGMADALASLPGIYLDVPEAWLFLDVERCVKSDMTLDFVQGMLGPIARDPTAMWEFLS